MRLRLFTTTSVRSPRGLISLSATRTDTGCALCVSVTTSQIFLRRYDLAPQTAFRLWTLLFVWRKRINLGG